MTAFDADEGQGLAHASRPVTSDPRRDELPSERGGQSAAHTLICVGGDRVRQGVEYSSSCRHGRLHGTELENVSRATMLTQRVNAGDHAYPRLKSVPYWTNLSRRATPCEARLSHDVL